MSEYEYIGASMTTAEESGQFTSLIKLSVAELEEKLRLHEFFVKSCKEEIARRKGMKTAEKSASEKSSEKKKVEKKKDDSDKKKSTIDATKDDMKAILKKNGIEFKVSAKKEDFEELIRKNNLVRIAEAHKKDRLKSEEK